VDALSNTVVVGPQDELMAAALVADDLRFCDDSPPESPLPVLARIRYRAEAVPASLSITGDRAEVRFECPQRAVTPGQAVVFYEGDRVLGGGTISGRL
jgi:tRNA-uridine 2-sulfurtransferase